MIAEYSLHNDSQMKRWDEYAASHPEGTAFHLAGWMRALQETYGAKPLLYVLHNGDGGIVGVAPFFKISSPLLGTRIVSLPFSDHSGPICDDAAREKELMDGILAKHRGHVRYIEIRSPLHDSCGLSCRSYYKRHILTLDRNPHLVMKKLEKRTIQYGIRKAARSDLEIREENTVKGMEEFYRLNRLTRKKHGVPSQPRLFFDKLFEHMVSGGYSSILLAYDGEQAVAGGFFSKFRDSVYYKYNASDPDYLDQTKRTPNHLLTWVAIQRACKEGYRYFDFGRTSPDNEGLMRYKAMWGAEPADLPYYYYPQAMGAASKEGNNLSYRMMTSVWRSLPDSVVDFIEPKIYKHMA